MLGHLGHSACPAPEAVELGDGQGAAGLCERHETLDVQTLLFKTSLQSRVGPILAHSNLSLNCYLLHLAFIILLIGIENGNELKVSMLVINVSLMNLID